MSSQPVGRISGLPYVYTYTHAARRRLFLFLTCTTDSGPDGKTLALLIHGSGVSLQEYQQQAREARRAAREDARQAAEEGNAIEPLSAVAQRRLRQEMPHELAGHCRPGVMSRWPHSLQDYQATIDSTQVCCCCGSPLLKLRKYLMQSHKLWWCHRVRVGYCTLGVRQEHQHHVLTG